MLLFFNYPTACYNNWNLYHRSHFLDWTILSRTPQKKCFIFGLRWFSCYLVNGKTWFFSFSFFWGGETYVTCCDLFHLSVATRKTTVKWIVKIILDHNQQAHLHWCNFPLFLYEPTHHLRILIPELFFKS